MNVSIVGCRRLMSRLMACSLAFLLVVPLTEAATDSLPNAPQPAATSPQAAGQNNQTAHPTNNQANPAPSSQNTADRGQYSSSQPVGTAVAPLIKPVGVAASRPAGAAIAPAKQRRIRVLAIRWGLILGGALALGTVAAATMGSPRRPN